MDNFNNKVTLSTSHLFYVDHNHSFYNESITFLCVIQGEAQVQYRQYSGTMQKGDILLCKQSGKIHLQTMEKTLFLTVHFDYIFFTEHFKDDFDLLECNPFSGKKDYPNLLSTLIKLSISHTSDEEDNRFLIQHQIFELFHLLKLECIGLPDSNREEKSTRQAAKLKLFTSYLKSNYMSPLTLQSVADYMNYTPQYLSNFIKKQLGTTFNGYLNRLRLNSAVNYLKFRNMSIEQISFLCGFANVASFQKIFQKEYLTTPEQFRKDYHNSFNNSFLEIELFTEPAFIRDYLSNSVQTTSSLSPSVIENVTQVNCVCNVHDTTPLIPIWRDTINLGAAFNFQAPGFRSHIQMLQQELNFRYGRIVNILSLARTYYTENRKYIFNFSRIFEVLDFLKSIHIRPFLDLGDKAPSIYLPDSPVTLGEFQEMDPIYAEMIPEFLSACIHHYGLDEVSTWRFELWMRYLNPAMTEMESPDDYCKRFTFLYNYVKMVLPDAQVGAPGFNTYASMDIFNRTLHLLSERNVIPDFISAYIYPYQPTRELGSNAKPKLLLSNDPDFFKNKIFEIKAIMAENRMENLPLYITEFSTYVRQHNFFNDSVYQALFVAKQYLCNWKNADSIAYFTASDASTEYPNTNQFLFGGNGIISRSGIKKPGYHTFGFLSMLGTELVAEGENYILTHSHDDKYQAILYNYAHFTPDYCRNFDRYELTKYPDAAFEEKPPIELTFHIDGLPSGTYKIGYHFLSSEHGSVFHEWAKLDYCSQLNPMEVAHFKGICVPDLTINTLKVNGTLTLTKKLYKSEICFLSIDRIS